MNITVILMKFCMVMHIGPPDLNSCSKIQSLKIQDDGLRPFSKPLRSSCIKLI